MSGFTDWLFGTSGDAVPQAQTRQNEINNQLQAGVTGAVQPYKDLTGRGDLPTVFGGYMDELTSSNPSQYGVTAPTLTAPDPLGTVNNFLDPSMQFQIDQATKAVQGSHAGRGGLFSGAAGQDISNATRQIAETGWGQAFDRARTQGLDVNNVTQQNFGNEVTAGGFNLGLDQTRLDNMGKALETAYKPQDTVTQSQLDMEAQLFGTRSGMSMQEMQAKLADKGVFGDLVSTGADLWASYLGGQ